MSGTAGQSLQAADAWTRARDAVGLFADGIALPPLGAARSRILETAMRLETAIRRADLQQRLDVSAGRCAAAIRCLRRLAVACETEFAAIGPTLSVPPGPRPLSDDRVRQWLRKDTFRATPPDLFVALAKLRSAGRASGTRPGAGLALSPAIA
jgi:hypothetical protein